jgi:hypothetical protein
MLADPAEAEEPEFCRLMAELSMLPRETQLRIGSLLKAVVGGCTP